MILWNETDLSHGLTIGQHGPKVLHRGPRILVDGDQTSLQKIVLPLARFSDTKKLNMLLFAHVDFITKHYANIDQLRHMAHVGIIVTETLPNAADKKITKAVKPGDFVISADCHLRQIAASKGGDVYDQSGRPRDSEREVNNRIHHCSSRRRNKSKGPGNQPPDSNKLIHSITRNLNRFSERVC